MAKGKSKQATAEQVKLAFPHDPNRCFVLFPSAYLTAGSAAVSLHSLLRQVEKHPSDRPVQAIRFDPDRLVLEVLFVPLEGGEHDAERGTDYRNSV
ncbi:hypothetical protein KDJ56_11030 [Brevibacillus composti]|uniref:Uncharacterized protein n=1 Tax=Brevibacillus composti TaxID=2796470 RepID=A0ABX7ZAF8_9BACL|nr:hypothetical protein [Brevibacillus composti]QUO43434.1 hypothetical protein KDJ56_11030 [Brevibacillus composti]